MTAIFRCQQVLALLVLPLMMAVGVTAHGAESVSASRDTVLSYALPTANASMTAYEPAIFGNAPVAQLQAGRIVAAWTTEPVSLPWTSLMLEMIVKHKIAPTRAARGSALLHVAMYDAAQLADDAMTRRIAVSTAAAQVLGYWFPAEEHGFDRVLAALFPAASAAGAAPSWSTLQRQQGLRLGTRVGTATIARAQSDGAERGWNGLRLEWYGEGRYYGPGAWHPTPPYFYYPPDEPFAASWKTWVLKSASQFRPSPPAFGSARFIKDLREVVDLQKTLTPAQREIAKFWVDGSGSVTPPGHWNQIAVDLVRKHALNEPETVKLFAILNMALADTFIAAWDVKYHYWTARPVTLAPIVLGVQMQTAILTPPFPSYLSGHAAFSGAGARVIGDFFPGEASSLDAMADEAAMSRLYGGIHFRHDNDDGLTLGRTISSLVLRKWRGGAAETR